MKSVTKLGWTAYALAAFVIVADQLSKHWILFVYDLPSRFSVPIAGPFSLTMVWNRGVSFGLFRADADLEALVRRPFWKGICSEIRIFCSSGNRRTASWALPRRAVSGWS